MAVSGQGLLQILQYGLIVIQIVNLEAAVERGIIFPLSLLWIHATCTFTSTSITSLGVKLFRNKPDCRLARPQSSMSSLDALLEHLVTLLDTVLTILVVETVYYARSLTFPFLFFYHADTILHLLRISCQLFRPRCPRSATLSLAVPFISVIPFVFPILFSERKLDRQELLFVLPTSGLYLARIVLRGYLDNKYQKLERGGQWSRSVPLFLVVVITTFCVHLGLEGVMLSTHRGFEKFLGDLHPAFLIPSFILGITYGLEEHITTIISCPKKNDESTSRSCDAVCGQTEDPSIPTGIIDSAAILFSTHYFILQTPTYLQILFFAIFSTIMTCVALIFDRASRTRPGHRSRGSRCSNEEDDATNVWFTRQDITDEVAQKLLNEETSDRSPSPMRSRQVTGMNQFLVKLWIFCLTLLATRMIPGAPLRNQTGLTTNAEANGALGGSFKPSGQFEIVISHYKEDLEEMEEFINDIKTLDVLQGLNPKVTIYTKYNLSDVEEIKAATRAEQVALLPNKGREGGTYLHHIINNWDKLAHHTLFIQAEPHHKSRLLSQLTQYFDHTRTGMLDLGSRELRGCKCLECADLFSWVDKSNTIPELMAKAYGYQCEEESKVSISYKGQFVVSAKRIRALRKSVYEDLQEKLIGENRLIMGPVDPIDAPLFGYTVERSWNILFQCAELTGVRDVCPGLTLTETDIGDMRPARPEDCGCLDS